MPQAAKKYLYLNGVVTRDLTLALITPHGLVKESRVVDGTRTEHFLPALAKFVGTHHPSAILVAQGGGSFSQTRLVCAIANALAYAWGIKVAAVPSSAQLADIATLIPRARFGKMLLPSYYGPAVEKKASGR